VALRITDQCVNCDVCEPVCPNQAIAMGSEFYEIAADRCTECVGHQDEPQCVLVCPVECILPDADHSESRATLFAKYTRLTGKET
jgi:ferredoxin